MTFRSNWITAIAATVVVLVGSIAAADEPAAVAYPDGIATLEIAQAQAVDLIAGKVLPLHEARSSGVAYVALDRMEHSFVRRSGLFRRSTHSWSVRLEVGNVDLAFTGVDGVDYWASTTTAGWPDVPARKTSTYYWTVAPDRVGQDIVFRTLDGAVGVMKITKIVSPKARLRRRIVTPAPASSEPRRRFVATLNNGATVEVIGLARHPSDPGTWWAPDGSPLARAPYLRDESSWQREVQAGHAAYEMALRISVPEGSGGRSRRIAIEGNRGGVGVGSVDEFGNRLLGHFETHRCVFKLGRETTSLRIWLAIGEWSTVLEADTAGGEGPADRPKIQIGPVATDDDGEMDVEAVVSGDWRQHNTRFLGVGDDGSDIHMYEHTSRIDPHSDDLVHTLKVDRFGLAGHPPPKVVKVRFQYRPYVDATFENMTLTPGRKIGVRITDAGGTRTVGQATTQPAATTKPAP